MARFRRADYEAQQAYTDQQDADLEFALQRAGKTVCAGSSVAKEVTQGEESAKPIPLAPRPWIREIPTSTTPQVAVPSKRYHQVATIIGMDNVPVRICYQNNMAGGSTGTIPGDRNTMIKVYAGQTLWMSSNVTAKITILVEPYLGDQGQILWDGDFDGPTAGTGSR